MKILDDKNRKDYYDYLSNNIYGVDDKIILHRKEYIDKQLFPYESIWVNGSSIIDRMNFVYDINFITFGAVQGLSQSYKDEYETLRLGIFSICGVGYPILIFDSNFLILTKDELDQFIVNKTKSSLIRKENRVFFKNLYKSQSFFFEWSNKLNYPYFIIKEIRNESSCNRYRISIENKLPLLKDIKFNKVMSDDCVYKMLYNYIINNIPLDPPILIDNKEKIIKAGFDNKKSFRHRK